MRLPNALGVMLVVVTSACHLEEVPARPNGLDGTLLFAGDHSGLATADTYTLSVQHPYACSNPCLDLGKGGCTPVFCNDDVELVSATCSTTTCTVSAGVSTERSVAAVEVTATEPGSTTLTVRVRHTGTQQEWTDRLALEFARPTGISVVGAATGGGRGFLPGVGLAFTATLLAADRELQHTFDASEVQVKGGLRLEPEAGAWAVTTVSPGPASVSFTSHGLTTELPVTVVSPERLVGFELYGSTVGTGAGEVTADPLAGHPKITAITIGHDAWNTNVFPVARLDDGTLALGAAPLATTSDPRLSVESLPALDNDLFVEVNRAKPAGDGLVTFSHGATRTTFPVIVE
jgi:hypothetical protein